MIHAQIHRARPFLTGCWLFLLVAMAAPTFADDSARASCTCPLGFGNWMRFEDSNSRPNMPDFWIEDALEVDEISVCSHGVAFVFTTRQDDNLVIAALFFPEPSAEFSRSRLGWWSTSEVSREMTRLMERYTSLRSMVEQQFGSYFDEYGRVVFRSMPDGVHPNLLDPHHRLALDWKSNVFELRGYLDVYFTQLM